MEREVLKMDEKKVIENYGSATMDFLQMVFGGSFAKMENLILTNQKHQVEFENEIVDVLEVLKDSILQTDTSVKALDQQQKDTCNRVEYAIEGIKVATNGIKQLKQDNVELKHSMSVIHDNVAVVHKTLESLVQSVEQIKQDNLLLKQENAELRQLEKNLSDHKQDDTRHIKRINGATEKNLARASEANQQRGQETNIKIFRAIFGYLQNAQDKSKVDMSWLLKTTGLSESTIRQTVRELQEHKLDSHIEKRADNTYLFYGLVVPMEFLNWYKRGNFFNVPR